MRWLLRSLCWFGLLGSAAAWDGGAVAVQSLDARALRTLHLDLLGRPPLATEVEHSSGKQLAEVVDAIVGEPEFWSRWFEEQLYYFLLVNNFRPQSERMSALPADLASSKVDVREAVHLIALSANFDQRNPGADTFVTVVMEQLLGLQVQKNARELEIGKHLYDGGEGTFLGARGNSQADVVRIAVRHKGFSAHFIGREYERFVHARADPKELAYSATEFAKDPGVYTNLVKRWLNSEAYRARLEKRLPLENRLFVCSLFVDLLGRVPTEAEAEPMRQALDGLSDPAPLRSVLVRMMIDSGRVPVEKRSDITDPAGWVRARFTRFYGRSPSESELATFVAAFNEPECRPQTILCALLSSPEYQLY
ncbi:MAG: hypothetical protein JNL28_12685 [Planctomycetes bacterium]|nr:hypothetical protein [Planctomycetota bacterium]